MCVCVRERERERDREYVCTRARDCSCFVTTAVLEILVYSCRQLSAGIVIRNEEHFEWFPCSPCVDSVSVSVCLSLSLSLSVGKFLHYAEAVSGEVPESVEV